MRKYVIAGNWKMNKTLPETKALAKEICENVTDNSVEVVICPPFVNIGAAIGAAAGSNVFVGAQNMHFEDKGAYTGEISADMLTAIGVKYVIIGHSERRQYFAETDETVNKKTLKALEKGLVPIVCVGESLQQRKSNDTASVIDAQTKAAFADLTADIAEKVVIAYEPIWAIGTGEVATNEQANEVCVQIRGIIKDLFGGGTADKIRILYGGSMNAKNAAGLLEQSDIDGGLIGGASLICEDFMTIVKNA